MLRVWDTTASGLADVSSGSRLEAPEKKMMRDAGPEPGMKAVSDRSEFVAPR
jgi:hypothetical protein